MERLKAATALRDASTRSRVRAIIEGSPGLPMHELAQRSALSWSALHHHVERLTAAGDVVTHMVGRRRLVFPREPTNGMSPEQRGLLYEDAARRMATWIVAHPARSLAELSAETGLSARAVYHHAKRLLDAGLISTQGATGYRGISPTPALLTLLADLG